MCTVCRIMLPHFLFHSETLRLQGLKCKARGSKKCKAQRLEARNTRLEGSRLEGSKYKARRLEARRLEARNTRLEGSRLEGSRLEGSRLEGSRLKGLTYRILFKSNMKIHNLHENITLTSTLFGILSVKVFRVFPRRARRRSKRFGVCAVSISGSSPFILPL